MLQLSMGLGTVATLFRDGCNMLQNNVSVSKMIIIKNIRYNNITVLFIHQL